MLSDFAVGFLVLPLLGPVEAISLRRQIMGATAEIIECPSAAPPNWTGEETFRLFYFLTLFNNRRAIVWEENELDPGRYKWPGRRRSNQRALLFSRRSSLHTRP